MGDSAVRHVRVSLHTVCWATLIEFLPWRPLRPVAGDHRYPLDKVAMDNPNPNPNLSPNP